MKISPYIRRAMNYTRVEKKYPIGLDLWHPLYTLELFNSGGYIVESS
jgi:hypothetical protein